MKLALPKLIICLTSLICLRSFAQIENNSSKILSNEFAHLSIRQIRDHSKNNIDLSSTQKVDSIAEKKIWPGILQRSTVNQ